LLFRKQIVRVIRNPDLGYQAAVLMGASLVLSTISWNHHYTIMIFPLAFFFARLVNDRSYAYLIPFFLITPFIVYHPRTGGFPFNLFLLLATILFVLMMIIYFDSKGKRAAFQRKP
jgi:hypothetical protein